MMLNLKKPKINDFTRRNFLFSSTAVVIALSFPLSLSAQQKVTQNDIAYDVTGNGDAAIIFVHGWSCDRSYWREQIDYFKEKYTVVTVDLGGHGNSTNLRKDWSIDSYGNDVVSVGNEIEAKNIILVGHSMGGPVVVDAAEKLGNRVESVIGVDTIKTPTTPPFNREAATQAWAPFTENFPAKVEGFVRSSFFVESSPKDLIDEVDMDMAMADPQIALEAGIGLLMFDTPQGIKNINDIPLTLINADYSPTDITSLQSLHPKANVITVPDCGHFIMMEKPNDFNQLLDDEISKILTT